MLLGAGVLALTAAAAAFHFRMLYRRSEEEQENHRSLIENLYDGIYRSTPDGRQLSANKALVRLNGYDSEDEMLASVNDIATEWYVVPTRRDEFRALLRRHGFVTDFVSEVYRHKTRERIWVTESARLVRERKTGRPLFYEGSVREITETVNRLEAEERLRKLSSQVPGGLIQFVRRADGSYTVPFMSSGFRELYGLGENETLVSTQEITAMVPPEDRPAFLENVRAGTSARSWDQEYRVTLRDGTTKWLQISAKPEAVEDGVIWHGYISDITTRKASEAEIEKLAFFDPLTGLPNRRMFMDRMACAVSRCREHDTSGALLFIDLDNFKTLNDTRGHDVGDCFLTQVAERLKGCVGPRDTVARIGGDEFVIILGEAGPDRAGATQAAILAGNKVLSAMREDFPLGEFSHRSSASLGIVVFDGENASADEILKQADIAMYRVKSAGRNGMALYDHQSMNAEAERYRLLDDFRQALAGDGLELHFQPQMDENRRVAGAEALCRWNHPRLGLLMPERFVPLTEQFGLIREFGNRVLARGVAELARWRASPATRHLRLAVNINVQSLACDDFVANLAALIESHGVDARLLTLEMTESVMAKDRRLIARRMLALKKLGVRLSLDDFGSGYSSLAYLKRLPFDELKIDGGFVADIGKSESDRQLVKSILGTARTLRLTAVAEHVEEVAQETFLRAFGCDYFQGYLYSPALPSAAFIDFVERNRHGWSEKRASA
ncbi:MAG: EAL domain-containing protein [Aquamicrobium sp.]|uniref:putative bifunctional diguanylate cyclase/phosphodiesterase n=1 Tax=Aquamicrobium sp. TaxID=1872579 RepID=UPI00349EC7AC|nr:EAL domain-containing protein [Aquamicrobium sp.]